MSGLCRTASANERDPEIVLEIADTPADGGGRYVFVAGSGTDIAGTGRRKKYTQCDNIETLYALF